MKIIDFLFYAINRFILHTYYFFNIFSQIDEKNSGFEPGTSRTPVQDFTPEPETRSRERP